MKMSRTIVSKIIMVLALLLPPIEGEDSDDDKVDFQSLGNQIGLAYEAFSPCGDGFIFMDREIGRPPEVEVYWNGSINFSVYKDYIKEARVVLKLDHPATMTVDSNVARVHTISGNEFSITPYGGVPDSLKIVVLAPAGKPFPNIEKVELNGVTVCKKLRKWSPAIIGNVNEAVAFPLLPENYELPHCGRKILDYTQLVTKGTPTKPGDWPWHVALYHQTAVSSVYRCGGSLISWNFIITAAHCVVSRSGPLLASSLRIKLGKYDLKVPEPYSQEKGVSQVLVHPDFNIRNLKNDIALMRIEGSIIYTDYVQPVCMWSKFNVQKESIWGKAATVVGWGTTENDTLSDTIQLGTMAIVSDVTCLLSFPNFYNRYLDDTSFCAGNGPHNGTSVCNGDSGGGLVLPITLKDGKVAWFIRGIVSISVSRPDKDLCDPSHYIVFTDVAKYLDWIHLNTDLSNSLVNG